MTGTQALPDPAALDLATRGGVRAALVAFDLRLRPSRGQHFLTSRRVLARMLAAADITPDDVVLEVGAGVGTLTVALARTGAHVVAVEVDARFIPVLRWACGPFPHAKIVHADAMRVPWSSLPDRPTKVVANLPYAIASPLLVNLLEAGVGRRYVVMLQQEVADRIVASPGGKTYGLLSVAVQASAVPSVVARVPRSAFYPPPQVTSALLRLDVREAPAVPRGLAPVLMAVARAAFGQRRKMLRTALRRVEGFALAADEVEALCRRAGIDPGARGERLSVDDFARLARALADRE